MKNYIISALFILISLSGMSQNAIELKENPDNRLLGYKIFEELGMEYHDNAIRITFDWKKVFPLNDSYFGSTVMESVVKKFGKDNITTLPINLCFFSESVSSKEIGNVYLNDTLQIKDVADSYSLDHKFRYERECLGTSTSGDGLKLYIRSRNLKNENITYEYTFATKNIILCDTCMNVKVDKFK